MINLLYIVLAIYFLLKFINPLIYEIISIKKQNNLIKEKIYLDNKALINKRKIETIFKEALKEKSFINKIFFNPAYNETQVFTSVQRIIKFFDKQNKVQKIVWGNTYIINNVKVFPITIYLTSTPYYFEKFIKRICKSEKLFFISFLKIDAINKFAPVKYQIQILSFQKLKEKNIEKNK